MMTVQAGTRAVVWRQGKGRLAHGVERRRVRGSLTEGGGETLPRLTVTGGALKTLGVSYLTRILSHGALSGSAAV